MTTEKSLRGLMFISAIGLVVSMFLATGCANSIDSSRRAVAVSYRVYAAGRNALDQFDDAKQKQIVDSTGDTLESVKGARDELKQYREKRNKAVDALSLLYSAIGSCELVIAELEAKKAGADLDLGNSISALYRQALIVKDALQDLGITLGGVL